MYSKYNTGCGKRQYFGPQVADREYIFVGHDIEIKNYSSCPPTTYLNIEDDKIAKIPKCFQQDLKVLNASTYDFENRDNVDGDFELIPLSPLWGHNHNDQRHDHYHHKVNEYQYPKINHQHHQAHQCKQHHHHNDHSHKYRCYKKVEDDDIYCNFNISPPSVQHKFVNKNDSINNNYDNKYYKTAGERFIGEYYHHQSLPTDCLQVKSLSQTSPTFVSNQHYQHYYSYFYNQNTRNIKIGSSSESCRKLPITSIMPSSKKKLNTYDVQLKAKCGITCVERNNCNDVENNHRQRYNYVLTEKSTNNNDAFNNVGQAKLAAGDYLYIKNFDTNNYKTSQSLEEDSKAALLYLQKHKNKRKLRNNSAESVEHWYYNYHSVDPIDSISKNENKINYNEIPERQQELKTLNGKTLQNNIKLPTTPTKVNAKKYSSPSKHRRVLIYNIQSPRLSTSHVRLQRSKLKLNSEIKGGAKKLAADISSQENKHVVDNGLFFNTASYNKDLRKIICDNNKNKDAYNNEDNKNNSEDNSDDDEDDEDFDNDFDSSSDTSDTSSDSEEGYKSYAYKLTHSSDGISTSISLESSINSETDIPSNPDALLVPSLFPNVPPYLAFSSNTKKGPEVPSDLYRILKWRVSNVMPRVVRSILANSGMRLLKKTNEWMGVWGKHMKSPCFKSIRPYQKINHLPGSFKIGRKDSCWRNLVRLMTKHGKRDFGFMPKTYIIPNDLKQLRKSWPKYSQKNVKWIIKPPAGARGTGIRVVDSWGQIPKRKPLIVQKYIERPLLINGSKFDLRLYVLVTSINPLRVFLYHNGLARFASVKYSDKSDTLNDRCMHLTNYSINKLSSNYSKNEDVNACHGHKWTIKSLWAYLSSRGVRTDLLWAALRSLVLRTILAGENSINNMIKANVESKYSCFELFGFDILLDADLIPWLLEVNISPSLHSELPLDSYVKAPLVQSVLNTALFNIPPKIAIERQREIAVEMSLPPGPICYDKRMYINYLSRSEKIKHNSFTRKNMEERDEVFIADKRPFMLSDNLLQFIASKKLPVHYE